MLQTLNKLTAVLGYKFNLIGVSGSLATKAPAVERHGCVRGLLRSASLDRCLLDTNYVLVRLRSYILA